MTSSASDAAFERLARPIQKWIHAQEWTGLHEAQAKAVEPVIAGDRDVLVTAATAGGKTEAAFLPILSNLLRRREAGLVPSGVEVLYLSPLKALINDQFRRLEQLGEDIDIPVHPWHGDIAAGRKKRVWRDRAGVLLITPESVEGLLCNHGERAASLLGGLRYVVVDELHAFPGSARGAQLASLLHRLDLICRRRVPRIGLSATVGDLDIAAEFLRPGRGSKIVRVEATADGRDRRTKLHGHTITRGGGGFSDISRRLWTTLRGTTNLVFANQRSEVESFADRLRQECEWRKTPNEFFAHHGSLSKAEREDVEERLRSSDLPATAVCTSTLEMGINIGQVKEVAQVRPPPSVAALRQRWGRSGRKPGDASILRTYITETALEPTTTPQDAVRSELFQAVAMLELVRVHDWCEEPEHGGLHLSTLVQQVLSLTAQHSGIHPHEAESVLCSRGPFAVDPSTFHQLLDAMHTAELLMSSSDGLLLPGRRGEREIEHFSFFAAFATPAVFRVVAGGDEIGSVDAGSPLVPGRGLVLAGRRWRVIAVHPEESLVEVVADTVGTAPRFPGGGAARVHDRVREVMQELYLGDVEPPYLDEGARRLLAEGRTMFAQLGLHSSDIVDRGSETVLFPWRGDKVLDTLIVALSRRGFGADREGPALVVSRPRAQVEAVLADLAQSDEPDPVDLAATVVSKAEEKWDEVLSAQLLDQAYAARALDVPGAWAWLRSRHEVRDGAVPAAPPVAVPALARPAPVDVPVGPPIVWGATPFAVIDVETTGLSAGRGHRIVEIAVVRCSADGTVQDRWHTLLDPARDVGPVRVHGIRSSDVRGAPSFADVAGDVAERLAGRIVVAHNARFDLSFLRTEFERSGTIPPDWPVLCTMALSDRAALWAGAESGGRSLSAVCEVLGVRHVDVHSAVGDADATAAVLAAQLLAARKAGVNDAAGLGVSSLVVPQPWIPVAPSGRVVQRSRSEGRAPTTVGTWPSAGATAYADAVDRALLDGAVTSAESAQLIEVAREWAVGTDVIDEVHDRLVQGRPVSEDSRRHLDVVRRSGAAA